MIQDYWQKPQNLRPPEHLLAVHHIAQSESAVYPTKVKLLLGHACSEIRRRRCCAGLHHGAHSDRGCAGLLGWDCYTPYTPLLICLRGTPRIAF